MGHIRQGNQKPVFDVKKSDKPTRVPKLYKAVLKIKEAGYPDKKVISQKKKQVLTSSKLYVMRTTVLFFRVSTYK